MSSICTAGSAGSHHYVGTSLLLAGTGPATGDAIYHHTFPAAKTQRDYYCGSRILNAAGTGTVAEPPATAPTNNRATYISSIHLPRYLPS